MSWYKVKSFRKCGVFEVHLNENFDLREKTDMRNWENPQLLYMYKSLIAKTQGINSSLRLVGSYPNYKFISGPNMSNDSLINVLAFEGDGEGVKHIDTTNGTWKKMKFFGKHKVIELNESNNFTVDLKQFSNGTQWNNLFVGVAIKEANLHPYFRQFDYSVVNKGDSVYQINPRMFGCVPYNLNSTNIASQKATINVKDAGYIKILAHQSTSYKGTGSIIMTVGNEVILTKHLAERQSDLEIADYITPNIFTGTVTISTTGYTTINSAGTISYKKEVVEHTGLELYALFLEVN